MKISMYQATCGFRNSINIRETFYMLKSMRNKTYKNDVEFDLFVSYVKISELRASPKGRLGVKLFDINDDDVGSLHIKIETLSPTGELCNMSILLFESIIKISAGIPNELNLFFEQQKANADQFFEEYVQNIFNVISNIILIRKELSSRHNKISPKISLINGISRVEPFARYFPLVDKIIASKMFPRVIYPLVQERGRIGACKVYPDSDSNASAHFCSKGSIQLFAFKRISDMQACANKVEHIIESHINSM